jgi:hypothetical protein
MRSLVLIIGVLLLGCTSHAEPEPLLLKQLRQAVDASCTAMQVADADRPKGRALDDQLNMLAFQSAPDRVADIRSGAFGKAEMKKDINELLFALSKKSPPMAPPRMFSHLSERVDELSAEELLLLNALARQLEREARLR